MSQTLRSWNNGNLINDMLILRNHDPPGLLKNSLGIPVPIHSLELGGNSVVLPEPEGVHGGEARLLISPGVTSQYTPPTCVTAALCLTANSLSPNCLT